MSFQRVGESDDLVIVNIVSGDEVTIENQFLNDDWGIEVFFFESGDDSITREDIEGILVAIDEPIFVAGTSGDDTLQGGTGDDTLRGEAGSDEYLIGANDGNDFINDFGGNAGDIDRIVFDADVSPADLVLSRPGDDPQWLRIDNTVTGSSIEVRNQFTTNIDDGIEEIVFADGTIWDVDAIADQVTNFVGTPDADFYFGASTDEAIRGEGGDDILRGEAGSDTYLIGANDGADFINDFGGNADDIDRLVFDGDVAISDLVFSRPGGDPQWLRIENTVTGSSVDIRNQFTSNGLDGIEEIEFSDGVILDRDAIADQIAPYFGTSGADFYFGASTDETIRGEGGDDILRGEAGSDTYLIGSNDGADFINDFGGNAVDVDRLVFDADVNVADLVLSRPGDDPQWLRIDNIVTGSSVEIRNQFTSNGSDGVEEIVFADGTIWDRNAIAEETMDFFGTNEDDFFLGTSSDENIRGAGGDDILRGQAGSDSYFFGANEGADFINDFTGSTADTDRIVFDGDVSASDIVLSRDVDQPSWLKIDNIATGSSIQVRRQFAGSDGDGVEEIVFDDGTVWDRATIAAQADSMSGSSSLLQSDAFDFANSEFLFDEREMAYSQSDQVPVAVVANDSSAQTDLEQLVRRVQSDGLQATPVSEDELAESFATNFVDDLSVFI